MGDAKREVERMRASAAAWRELRCEPAKGTDGHDFDRNAATRAKVLWALQYDRRPDDLPLIRSLVEQEALWRGEAPGQGLGEETELAGFLLAEHRQLEDMWLHWKIKSANFDTGCGYDQEYLLAAGVAATIDFVRGSAHAERNAVLECLLDEQGRPWILEDDLARWWQSKPSWFPADPADEDPLTWVYRAKLVGDRDLARQELDRWAAGRPLERETLNALRYELADLGVYAEAAQAQRESLRYADTPRDAASAWRDLAELERLAGDHHAAWDALREYRRALDGVPSWTELGHGRMYVAELFLLAESAEGELAQTVFAEASRQARVVPTLSPDGSWPQLNRPPT